MEIFSLIMINAGSPKRKEEREKEAEQILQPIHLVVAKREKKFRYLTHVVVVIVQLCGESKQWCWILVSIQISANIFIFQAIIPVSS